MAMPPMLRWALRRLPLRDEERQRLEREDLDARGFVPNLERLLLAVDGSANGTLASRLAGAVAGSGEKPTTVIELEPNKWPRRAARADKEEPEDKVRDSGRARGYAGDASARAKARQRRGDRARQDHGEHGEQSPTRRRRATTF